MTTSPHSLLQQKQIVAALSRLSKMETLQCFDPVNPKSRPTATQLEVLQDIGSVAHRYVTAGNQCLPAGTLVMTPKGPVSIESILPGDMVYDEYGKEITVLKTFQNGPKEVADLTLRGVSWASCTPTHAFQIVDCRDIIRQREVGKLGRDDKISRVTVRAPLGHKRVKDSYALGALLGDGCSRQSQRYIQISSETALIPDKVAGLIGNTARKLHESNYTWSVGYGEVSYYQEWCKGRYAHEKIVDIEELRNWDRQSLLDFVAGVVDTDGSIYAAQDHISISVSMQAKSVIDALRWAFLALWQVPMSLSVDAREGKYKNGPVYNLYTRNSSFIRDILLELDPYIVSPQKKWREEYATLGGKRTRHDCLGLKYGFNRRVEETYDIHVASSTNLYLLANGLVTHNSGKSQLAAREVAWVFTESHPFWKRNDEWGSEPLLLLIVSRVGAQGEDVLWRKISAFLDPADYTIKRSGSQLEKVIHNKNGNTLLFKSHHNEADAREKLQAYVAHYVWLDELPRSFRIIEELHRRVQAKKGPFLATFTPKDVNIEIQKIVDHGRAPYSKKYQFHMFDNPIYSEKDKADILASMSTYSETYRNTLLRGDWATGEDQVYYFDYDTMVESPPDYSASWRHVEVVDPALKSALGLTVWAENPLTNIWYLVRADYVRGIYVPTELVKKVQEIVSGYRIVKRRADPHEVWYIQTAGSMGIHYEGVYKKNERKGELIKKFQESLGSKIRISPWCGDFLTEIQDCRWSDRADGKIVNASSYHLLDTAQYFTDSIPAPDNSQLALPAHAWLYQQNEKRKVAEVRKQISIASRIKKRSGRWKPGYR